jgi:hypothetical protein
MDNDEKGLGTIETHAIVEVFGHQRYAGFVQSISLGGSAMIRIDVPEIPPCQRIREKYDYEARKTVNEEYHDPGSPAFTKFMGVGSIFSITPCSKEVAMEAVRQFKSAPVTVLEMPQPRQLPSPTRVENFVKEEDDPSEDDAFEDDSEHGITDRARL